MPLYLRNDKTVFFAHIPKTGGGTIENYFRALGVKEALRSNKRTEFSGISPQHFHASVYRIFVPRSFYDYGFAVVRHPTDRLLSEYKWRRKLTRQPEFSSFEKWATRRLRDYPADPHVLDNHLRPQHEFIAEGIEWFKLENGLEQPTLAALTHLGYPGLVKPLVNMKVSQEFAVTISEELLAKVVEFYQRDYDMFGYDRSELPKGLTVGGEPFKEKWSTRIKMKIRARLGGSGATPNMPTYS